MINAIIETTIVNQIQILSGSDTKPYPIHINAPFVFHVHQLRWQVVLLFLARLWSFLCCFSILATCIGTYSISRTRLRSSHSLK